MIPRIYFPKVSADKIDGLECNGPFFLSKGEKEVQMSALDQYALPADAKGGILSCPMSSSSGA